MTASGKQYVTIASDISLSTGKKKIATWAFYIRGDFGTITKAGQFREYTKHTWKLETQALANALWSTARLCHLPDVNLIIYSELTDIHMPYLTKAGNIRKRHESRELLLDNDVRPYLNMAKSFEVRKVKAHSKERLKADAPKMYYMNDWCDKASRNLMKQLRKAAK